MTGYPGHILDLVEPRLASGRTAILDRTGTLTYAELDTLSAATAAALAERGIGDGDPVVVHARLSRWAVVGMLGVLRAGARYVPVDAFFPPNRQRYLAQTSGATVAVAEPGLPQPLPGLAYVDLGDLPGERVARRGRLAYTCFTSGSTGRPKGVTVSAAALAYSTAARIAVYPDPVRAFLLCSSISFDSSVAGIYWTLACGGTLVIPSDRAADLVSLGRAARRHRPSHLLLLPSLYSVALRGGLADDLAGLSTVIVAGEACPPALVGEHYRQLPAARLYNEYGPTEYTVWTTVHACTPADAEGRTVPIGRSIPGTTVRLVDDVLHVAGPGLAELETIARHDLDGVPYHRTGDLVTRREDGVLHWLGREDDQLKLGGVRLERAEVEHALATAPGVAAAGVGVAGGQLVGYVAPSEPGRLDRVAVRRHILSSLPAAVLPARLVAVDALPTHPNGKIDHATLDRRAAAST